MRYWILTFISVIGVCILFFWAPFLFWVGNCNSVRLPKGATLLDYCRFRSTFPYVLDPILVAYHVENMAFEEWISETQFEVYPWQPPSLDLATPTNLFKKYKLSDSWSNRCINENEEFYLERRKRVSIYYKPKVQTLIICIYDNPPDYFLDYAKKRFVVYDCIYSRLRYILEKSLSGGSSVGF